MNIIVIIIFRNIICISTISIVFLLLSSFVCLLVGLLFLDSLPNSSIAKDSTLL